MKLEGEAEFCLKVWNKFRYTESFKNIRVFPHVSHSVSPLLNILHFHRTLVKTKTNIDELLLTILHTLGDVTSFPIKVLFLFQDLFQGTTLHLVVMAPQLSLV